MPTTFTTKGASQGIASAHINDLQTAVNRVEKGTANYILSTGSSNAYVVTLSPTAVGGDLVAGFPLNIKAAFTNTAAATINTNSIGAVAIKVFSNAGLVDISAGMMQNGGHYQLRHDGTYWVLLNPHQTRWERGDTIYTPVGNVGTGEDDGCSFSLPANALSVNGQRLKATFFFTFAANAASKQFKVKLGATTLYDSTAQIQNAGYARVEVVVVRTGAATQQVFVTTQVTAGITLYTSTVTVGSATEDLTTALTCKSTLESVTTDDLINSGVEYTYG